MMIDALSALALTEVNDAIDFGHHCRILRRPGFEELGDARQTAGDVMGTSNFTRGGRQQRTGR